MYEELKKLAEAATPGPWGYDGSYVCPSRVEGGTTYVESWKSVADCHQPENTKFIAAANPSAVLALIAENERLALELKDFKWGASVEAQAGDEARAEASQLKAENEALRKDAERFRFIEQDADSGMRRIYGDDWIAVIDAGGFQPIADSGPRPNTGHGHVYPRADGVVARCGGPGLCRECSADAARKVGQ